MIDTVIGPAPRGQGTPQARGRAGRVALALAAALAVAPGAAGQEPPPDVAGNGLYSLPRSQDDIAEWTDAVTDISASRYDAAVERLLRLVRRRSPGVVPLQRGVDRYLGLRLAVVGTLRDLPPLGREAYERLARREAGQLYDARPTDLSDEQLEYLAESFPASAAGVRARLRLGDLALERGDGLLADVHYRAARDSVAASDPRRREVEQRSLASAAVSLHGEAGGARARGELADALRGVLGEGGATSGTWPAYGGGYDGARPMRAPDGSGGRQFVQQVRAFGFATNAFAIHAVGDLTGVYVTDGLRVVAIDPIGERTLWDFSATNELEVQDTEETVNPDMVLAPALADGVVVASLQVPDDGIQAQRFNGAISIIDKIPLRRLFAFERHGGKLLWSHWDSRDGEVTRRFRGHDVCGFPLIHGETVYVPTHDQSGAIAFYLSAYDLRSGAMRWRQLVCSSQQEVNMFGNARQEFAAGPLALHGGVVYGTSNLGVCFACDAVDGTIRWITGYDVIPLPRTRLRDQERRVVYFANNPIVIVDGVMATTPLDSGYALGFDTETGDRLWEVPYDGASGRPNTTIRWLLGALDGEFVFAGLGVVAVEARPVDTGARRSARVRVVASPESLDENDYNASSVPRGALTGDRIWFVGSRGGVRIFDRKGNRDPRMADIQLHATGNLLLTDGIAVLARDGRVSVHTDLENLVRAAERAVREAPGDPASLLRLGKLRRAQAGDRLDSPHGQRAIELFEQGLVAAHARGFGRGSAITHELAQGLFQISFARARQTAERDTGRGIEQMVAARDRAPAAEEWLTAQQELLALIGADAQRTLAELDTMVARHGPLEFLFRDGGLMPVAAWGLWRSLEPLAKTSPADAILRAQTLLERHPDVEVGSATMREIANRTIDALLRAHGTAIYAAIEARADEALRAVADDPSGLRDVTQRFPHSAAAQQAVARLLDLAVRDGDLGRAVRSFRETVGRSAATPGLVRRMQIAAVANGNLPLAHALGRRIVASHASLPSDYPADAGATLGELTAALPALPPPDATPARLPVRDLAFLPLPNAQSTLTYLEVEPAPGFAPPGPLPIYLAIDDRQLVAVPSDPLPRGLDAVLFAVATRGLARRQALPLCGDVLIVCEPNRVRGLDWQTGRERWTYEAERGRTLTRLGVHDGVLHLFSEVESTKSDGGRLLGVEPRSGALLFRHVFDTLRDSVTPVATDGALCVLDPGGRDRGPAIERFDHVTGELLARTPLDEPILRTLRLDGERAYRLHTQAAQSAFFADGERIWLHADGAEFDEDTRLVAIDWSGKKVAEWSGRRGTTIKMAAAHGDRIVVLERALNQASLLTVLDRNLAREFDVDVGARATPRNWVASADRRDAPDALVLQAGNDGTTLHVITFEDRKRRFSLEVTNTNRLLPEPILGPDWVAVACARPGGARAQLRVYTSGGRGALPGGELMVKLPQMMRPLGTFRHGRYTILETDEGILVLGPGETD